MRRMLIVSIAVLTALALAAPAAAQNNRGGNGNSPIVPAHVYVDGTAYDTIILGSLPWMAQNDHSFNDLYPVFLPDGTEAQGPVAAYAPGDTEFRGGRWVPVPVAWTQDSVDQGPLPLITSLAELHTHLDLGHLVYVVQDGDHRATHLAFMCPILK